MDFLKQSIVIEVVKQDGQINILVVEDNNYIRNYKSQRVIPFLINIFF